MKVVLIDMRTDYFGARRFIEQSERLLLVRPFFIR